METPSTAKIALKWGIIAAVVLAIVGTIMNMTEAWKIPGASMLTYTILLIGIIMALKEFKTENQGFMSFGEGVGLGMLLGAVAGLVSSIWSYIYLNFIDVTFLDKLRDFQAEQMEGKGLSDEQIEQAMEMSSKFMSGGMMFLFGMIGMLFFALIFSLIVSAFMKNNKPVFS